MNIMLAWTLIAFSLGSVPFSVLLTRFFVRRDIREIGDGNPGATNAWKLGGWRLGVPVILFDSLKGAGPVILAQLLGGMRGWALLPISLAALLGHAYTPWLKFKGGKALATTFGIWTGLTLGEVPIVLGLFFALFLWLFENEGWAVVFGFAGTVAHLLLNQPNLTFVSLAVCNATLLAWKYRHALGAPPRLRQFGKDKRKAQDAHA